MSEINLIQGDASHEIWGDHIAGQTFKPTYDHILEYIDLDLRRGGTLTPPPVLVYPATPTHHPTGDYISRDNYIVPPLQTDAFIRRIRYKMTPALLTMGEYYCIVVRPAYGLGFPTCRWSYKEAPSSYARGIRIYSNDGGDTWTDCLNEDFIFGEFGTPPTPPPPPDPPIAKVMPTDLEQIPIADGFKIIYHTNVPCHLWMRWTTTPPVKHIIPVEKRGIFLHKDIRQCFVAYHDNEQLEAGDTLAHTFIKTSWPICETRYFIFWGTNFDETVKSTSPIFTKHRVAALLMELLYLEPWSEYGAPPPEMALIFLEPWTVDVIPPPTMELKFLEPWTTEYPTFVLKFLEPWTTYGAPPPPMELKFIEPWTS